MTFELPPVVAKDARTTVYLCGPINGRSASECKDWRLWADERLVCMTYDPMTRDYRGRELEPGIAAEIVENDQRDIENSDFVLVYFDKPSVGTSMEVLYAWQLGKHTVIANVSDKPLSPWLLYHSTAQETSLAAAIENINRTVISRRVRDAM